MTDLLNKITDLNELVLQGKAMEAFDKYYHEEVVMQENESPATVGKAANKAREEAFFNNISEFRNAAVLKVTAGENTTMVEWHLDYTHKEWGIRNYTQVAVQEWENGKIKKEKFYYGA
jgi:hypothetical protein